MTILRSPWPCPAFLARARGADRRLGALLGGRIGSLALLIAVALAGFAGVAQLQSLIEQGESVYHDSRAERRRQGAMKHEIVVAIDAVAAALDAAPTGEPPRFRGGAVNGQKVSRLELPDGQSLLIGESGKDRASLLVRTVEPDRVVLGATVPLDACIHLLSGQIPRSLRARTAVSVAPYGASEAMTQAPLPVKISEASRLCGDKGKAVLSFAVRRRTG